MCCFGFKEQIKELAKQYFKSPLNFIYIIKVQEWKYIQLCSLYKSLFTVTSYIVFSVIN